MHPTYSIVFFTVASGAGYGLLFLLGLALLAGSSEFGGIARGPGFAFALGLGIVLVSAGLLASALHLGRPERALRALSQWRTSWLSREACLAAATYVPALALGFGWWLGEPGGAWRFWGLVLAAGAAATVYCTAMIYRSLEAVPRWANGWVPVCYLAFAAASGALWLAFVAAWSIPAAGALPGVAVGLLVLAALAKAGYWRTIGRASPKSTIESATGLGESPGGASVRLLDPPHTERSWLQQEMGYVVARRHARRLRSLVWLLAFGAPIVLCLAAWATADAWAGHGTRLALLLAVVSASTGLLIERWLFFAEAEHKMALYYGLPNA